ncbi:hypothetical protein BSKO_05369 [Bryopsis sp. KO-2023]|nr:hypothetical protein BSKO_05369 [Bryopsis sp. KO-2023]
MRSQTSLPTAARPAIGVSRKCDRCSRLKASRRVDGQRSVSVEPARPCMPRSAFLKLVGSIGAVDLAASTLQARSEDDVTPPSSIPSESKTVFLDVSVDRKPAGRIVIELFDDVPVGSQRFADLAVGKEGVAYRLSKFDSLRQTYVTNEGVKRLSYSDTYESPIAGGDSLQDLLGEFAAGRHSHDSGGVVSLLVKTLAEPQTKSRMVAIQGKLVTVEDQLGEAPNGTAFAITTSPCPQLNSTHLVVGRVVEGLETVKELQGLPTVKENNSSPFFMAAKTFGDKRADVAERGFGKPFNKVIVSKGGNV